jgi:hypothetical protein
MNSVDEPEERNVRKYIQVRRRNGMGNMIWWISKNK